MFAVVGELLLAFIFEGFICHRNIASSAEMRLKLEEELVASLKYIDFWVKEPRVMLHVQPTINLSESLVHSWPALLAELTVEDDDLSHHFFYSLFILEEKGLHLFWVINVYCVLDVAAFVFVIESTVYYHV